MIKQWILSFAFGIFAIQAVDGFSIPTVTLEGFTPKGFRASIPALEGIRLFGFHGNVNQDISEIEPGDYFSDVVQPSNGKWSYFNPDLKLEINDTLNFWVYVQHESVGYRGNDFHWTVTELFPLSKLNQTCNFSKTIVVGTKNVCKNTYILDDSFERIELDKDNWIQEQYIPTKGPDYEFCSYQIRDDLCYLKNNVLYLRPIPADSELDVRGELDLREGCTRNVEDECFLAQDGAFILPPVTSARIKSKLKFKYGNIQIKLKLPCGDWLYPQVYLQSVRNPNLKLWIAYARGNSKLTLADSKDLGSRMLFGGPVLSSSEPGRSTHLSSKWSETPFCEGFHTFQVTWDPSKIQLFMDETLFGDVSKDTIPALSDPMQLVLGVGVGGVSDFPDDMLSGENPKPWKNFNRVQVKNFFNARARWMPTWDKDNAALQVKHVKIWALN